MTDYHLTIDMGASSGRHILGWIEDKRIKIQEIHRFPNGFSPKSGHLCWDLQALFGEIIKGMQKCAEFGMIPQSVGIDTWGVDFVLLDKNGEMVGDSVSYRDSRTVGADEAVYSKVDEREIYRRTGIQKQLFNTVFQLQRVDFTGAEHFLMLPDFFHYKLCGVMSNEYTNASTTGLINAENRDWDTYLLERLAYPAKLFRKIEKPGTILGSLLPEVQKRVGFNCEVILPATHDTASAIAASSGDAYISSGTWSLLGTLLDSPDTGEKSRIANFSNEGAHNGKICYLKNIMGMWLIQNIRSEFGNEFSFEKLGEMAQNSSVGSTIDCFDNRFMLPDSMVAEIRGFCRETGQAVPETAGDYANIVYTSLAGCYAASIFELERLSGKTIRTINIVGGGSKDRYLNELVALKTGRKIIAGPSEATAIGNLMTRMSYFGK
ncbi:MAG: rhamnulokinase [Synergistaceae bacterium]|jgi:rhamnulokinase|nr:rhamnulokinase [Synergistaceae bacterium]